MKWNENAGELSHAGAETKLGDDEIPQKGAASVAKKAAAGKASGASMQQAELDLPIEMLGWVSPEPQTEDRRGGQFRISAAALARTVPFIGQMAGPVRLRVIRVAMEVDGPRVVFMFFCN